MDYRNIKRKHRNWKPAQKDEMRLSFDDEIQNFEMKRSKITYYRNRKKKTLKNGSWQKDMKQSHHSFIIGVIQNVELWKQPIMKNYLQKCKMHQNTKFPNVKKYSINLLQTHFQVSKRNSNQNFDLDFDVELGQKDLKGSGRLSALVNH